MGTDVEKAQRFVGLRGRLMRAAMSAMPGVATPMVVDELEAVYQGLNELLKAGVPNFPLYSFDDVRSAMADCLDFTARAYESMRDDQRAAEYFQRAAAAFDAIGKVAEAEKSRAKLRTIRISEGQGFDDEIKRLYEQLAESPSVSLGRAQLLVELGELTSLGGDDYAAKGYFQEALSVLADLGFGGPGGGDFAQALRDTLATISSRPRGEEGPTEIETMVAIRGLYRRIYLGFVRVYTQINPEQAKEFETKLAEMDNPEVSKEFAEQLRRLLPHLGAFDVSDKTG